VAKSDGSVQVIEPTEIQGPTPFTRWKENIEARARQQKKDGSRNSKIMQDQANAILSAETVADVWAADEGGLVNGQSMVNIALEIRGYEIAEAGEQYQGGDVDVYVNMDCVVLEQSDEYSPGDQITVNVGGLLVVTKLEMFRALNAFPVQAVIRPAGRALKLKPLPPRAVSSSTA
jgi:hypothetical protein